MKKTIQNSQKLEEPWTTCIHELFDDSDHSFYVQIQYEQRSDIMNSEVESALKSIKNAKAATDSNRIYAELLKLKNDNNLWILIQLFETIR